MLTEESTPDLALMELFSRTFSVGNRPDGLKVEVWLERNRIWIYWDSTGNIPASFCSSVEELEGNMRKKLDPITRRIESHEWYQNNKVEMKPWVWATHAMQEDPVELVSYPWLAETGIWRVMLRLKVGDPTSLAEASASHLSCFDPEDHPFSKREKVFYSDDPNVFAFKDEMPVQEA